MERLLIILALSFFLNCSAIAQSVIVNPDGTHSIVINNGSTSTIVNPDGTHSTAINHGSTSIIVNPNGTHSSVIHNGNISTIVNPNGTHSTVDNTVTSTAVTNSLKINIGDSISIANPKKNNLNKRTKVKIKDRKRNNSTR